MRLPEPGSTASSRPNPPRHWQIMKVSRAATSSRGSRTFLARLSVTGEITKTVIETAGSQSLEPTPAWNETSLPWLERRS